MESYLVVGRVHDAHGIKGELYVSLREAEAAWLEDLKTLRLQRPGEEPREFKILQARPHKHGFIARVEGILDRNEAERWRKADFSIPQELLIAEEGEAFYLGELLGFAVWTSKTHCLGIIEAFTSNSMQDLLNVKLPTGEIVEIPFVEEFVTEIDADARKVVMAVPAEFLDPQFWRA